MDEYLISVTELAYGILFLIAAILGVYLVIMVRNANETFKNFKNILSENREHIQTTIKNISEISTEARSIAEKSNEAVNEAAPRIPVIVNDVGVIAKSVKDSVKKVGSTVEAVGEGVIQTTDAVKSNAGDIVTYLKIIVDIIKTVIGMFGKK